MNHDSDIGVKAPKDVDSELMSRFLRAFFMTLLFLLFLFIVLFGVFWGFVIAFISSLITALFATFLSEKAAIILKIIYGDRKSKNETSNI